MYVEGLEKKKKEEKGIGEDTWRILRNLAEVGFYFETCEMKLNIWKMNDRTWNRKDMFDWTLCRKNKRDSLIKKKKKN